jgi:hypothetical protein
MGPERHGGRENLEAIDLLQRTNTSSTVPSTAS